MMTTILGRLALLSALLVLPTTASAVGLNVTGGGVEATATNFGCLSGSTACGGAEKMFGLATPGAATGTVSIVGGTATFDLSVTSFLMADDGGTADQILFEAMHYLATAPVITSGDPSTLFTVSGPTSPTTGHVTGMYSTFDSGGGVLDVDLPIDVEVEIANIGCLVSFGAGTCGIQFGQSGYTLADYDFVNTLDVVVTVAEPASLVLLGLGLIAAAGVRRRSP
jgi:hypothetical protein